VLVRFDHVAGLIVNANNSIMWTPVELCVVNWLLMASKAALTA